jgi:starch-binding outer membrane protein, SusD/RagB family
MLFFLYPCTTFDHNMLTIRTFTAFAVLTIFLLCSCASYVQDIPAPPDQISTSALNTPEQADFLVRGVQGLFATSLGDMVLYAGGLSDEFQFDSRAGTGGLAIFDDVDRASVIDRGNTTLQSVHDRLGQLRFHADDLIRRSTAVPFSNDSLRRRVVFVGAFYGAVARYFMASYTGINKGEGGGCINNGAFIPSAAMYDSAIASVITAISNAPTAYERRMATTFLERVFLLRQRYGEAQTAALAGLTSTDAPFRALYSAAALNTVWNNAGAGRAVYLAARRFDTVYIRQDPFDTARIKVSRPIPRPGGFSYIYQTKYASQDSPIPFLTWQENELLLAECTVRLGNGSAAASVAASAAALERINRVRTSYPPLRALPVGTTVTLDLIATERDKELFATGMRLLDQKRFGAWHLGAGTWQQLPLPLQEINNNPNLPMLVRD